MLETWTSGNLSKQEGDQTFLSDQMKLELVDSSGSQASMTTIYLAIVATNVEIVASN